MIWGRLFRGAVLLAAIIGVIRVARDGFVISLDDYLNAVLEQAEYWLRPVVDFAKPWIDSFFDWLRVQLHWDFTLQPHWHFAFALMQLFLGSFARAAASTTPAAQTWFNYISSFVCATIFGVLAGTVPLGHPAVLLYPIAGFLLFLAANRAWAAASASGGEGSGWNSFGSGGMSVLVSGIALLVLAARSPALMFFGSGISPAFGLLVLMAVILVVGIYLFLFGLPNSSEIADNQGTRMGTNILLVLSIAWGVVAASQYKEAHSPRMLSSPVTLANGSSADCIGCPGMIVIPAGSFQMGSDDAQVKWAKELGAPDDWLQRERPLHSVHIKQFSMSDTEITRDQFAMFLAENPNYKPGGFCVSLDEKNKVVPGGNHNWIDPGYPQGGDHPVVCVTWWDADAYVKWLSRKTGRKYRLPSEAEWEYAARAGSATGRFWGWENSEACRYANVWDSKAAGAYHEDPTKAFPCSDNFVNTAPVAHFQANAFGLHDMLGNVWEWTEDCWNENYNAAPSDGSSWVASGDCSLRVVRGGGWSNDPWLVRSAVRDGGDAAIRFDDIGFRVARTN